MYTYDATGNRVEKSNGSTGTIYWYMSPGIVAESDLSGNLKSEYVFFNGERLARKDFPGDTVSYYFSDYPKTASVITDSAGNITEDDDYYPWGGELQFVNGDSNHYKFTGKERDTETGLDYFGARYYGNWLGRWMSPDWALKPEAVPYSDLGDPQSLNLYGYVRDVPTSRADPDGHFQMGQNCPSCHDKLHDLDATQPVPNAPAQQPPTTQFPPLPPPITCISCVQQQNNGGNGGPPSGDSGGNSQSGSQSTSPPAPGQKNQQGDKGNQQQSQQNQSGPKPKTLQSGNSNTIKNATAKTLNTNFGENLPSREWGRALEALKSDNGLPNDFHGKIMSNGDFVDAHTGQVIGNIGDYLP
jgi:RHS repeat-associated protein